MESVPEKESVGSKEEKEAYLSREKAYHYSKQLEDEVEAKNLREKRSTNMVVLINLLLLGMIIMIIVGLYIHAYV